MSGDAEIIRVDSIWLEDKKSKASVREFTLIIDNPKERGGTNAGPRPTETLLAALGGCFITALSRIGERMRISLCDLRLELRGNINQETHLVEKINISVRITADQNDQRKLERLVQVAREYCTVSKTLETPTNITIELIK